MQKETESGIGCGSGSWFVSPLPGRAVPVPTGCLLLSAGTVLLSNPASVAQRLVTNHQGSPENSARGLPLSTAPVTPQWKEHARNRTAQRHEARRDKRRGRRVRRRG